MAYKAAATMSRGKRVAAAEVDRKCEADRGDCHGVDDPQGARLLAWKSA
jgi:hypothetical protein